MILLCLYEESYNESRLVRPDAIIYRLRFWANVNVLDVQCQTKCSQGYVRHCREHR